MTTLQKVIKYLAIGLAVFICLAVANAIVTGVQIIGTKFDFINNKKDEPVDIEDFSSYIIYDENISYLDIDVSGSNLIIRNGEELSVETHNKNVKVSQKDGKLKIVDKTKKINTGKLQDLVITLPEAVLFTKVDISTGAGKVSINGISTDLLEMELGAGKAEIKNIYSNKTDIETGVGNVEISNSSLNDLDLELGVGEISINAYITGNSSIESGIGSLDLNLNDSADMYKFNFEKGLGNITLNGEKITGNSVIGDGNNYLKISGGIGSIKIKTLE